MVKTLDSYPKNRGSIPLLTLLGIILVVEFTESYCFSGGIGIRAEFRIQFFRVQVPSKVHLWLGLFRLFVAN